MTSQTLWLQCVCLEKTFRMRSSIREVSFCSGHDTGLTFNLSINRAKTLGWRRGSPPKNQLVP